MEHRQGSPKSAKKTQKKLVRKTNKRLKQTKKYTINKNKKPDISLEKLKQLCKKYNIITSGSKNILAQSLWRLRGSSLASQDLELIIHLLDKSQQKKATQLIQDRINKPITNYQGMYEVNKKPITSMTRNELIKNLQKFRDSWEKITTINQDLSDERLKDESTDALRKTIKFYYSNSAKQIAEDWLRK
jgi:phosphoribosylaminoimidazole carboxylase (NCAIR synthetase)